jgi:hypothetical protein
VAPVATSGVGVGGSDGLLSGCPCWGGVLWQAATVASCVELRGVIACVHRTPRCFERERVNRVYFVKTGSQS